MDSLYLVAGLGNPGREYANTRHNAGFMVADRLASRWHASWKSEPRFRSLLARTVVGPHKVILCKPQTFMNSSGEALAAAAQFFKVEKGRLLVMVDDADLALGMIRLRPGGSSGGHHGLESIEQHLGMREFARLRVGIGRTEREVREITGHVLGRFQKSELGLLEKVLNRAADQAECFVTAGPQKAMNQFNGAVEAPIEKETK